MSARSPSQRSTKLSSYYFLVALAAVVLGPLPTPSAPTSIARADSARVDRTPAPVELPQTPAAAVSGGPAPEYVDPVTAEGQRARGLYFNADVVAAIGARGVIKSVRGARMNAAVIDLKDERGHVNYPTQIPELQRSRYGVLGDVPALVRELKAGGVYVIGRIVCFSDPRLPRRFPELAVKDSRPYKHGAIWGNWARRNPWLDPYNQRTHGILVDVAKEVEALGVDEIQLDYVRFPVDPATAFAEFPAKTDKPRSEVILGFLERVDRAVHVPLGVDVFGLSTMPWGKPEALGQIPEDWAAHVEVFSPMLYLNGMRAWTYSDGGSRAERLVALGVATLRKRIGDAPVIRPFLQGFPQGADHYDTGFIAEQIRGAKRAGADGFLFWHPASHYDVVREASVSGPAKGLAPFTFPTRQQERERVWSDAVAN